ncbi:rare lipoprotein A [Granulicella pectinivorans]|uniref:Probable endolytic peptidoglycan transglycosylase RlpA n=1 Tax=Granulicella pectinivorans TaxID=474950 RepID=A0A1I6LLD3_9BACT|nr:septal ring lytic transglycosylase RlpA family protein [Granulicella pectinivorans]SFS04285.1 rare lipoprotein A [Granulicella pectinivorans]
MLRYLKMDLIAAVVAVGTFFIPQRAIQMPVTPAVQVVSTPVAQANIVPIAKKTRHPFQMMANLGNASWYGAVLEGHRTASGETFRKEEMTAAHRTLPFGTLVRVVDVKSGKSVVVRINDRGVLFPDRIIDLSSGAAEGLGILRSGVAKVRLEILKKAGDTPAGKTQATTSKTEGSVGGASTTDLPGTETASLVAPQ